MSRLIWNDREFLLDGEPFQILSGAIHYFRVVPEYWEDRLRKLKECGMNTVETYTCWNLHERREGQFDFTGRLNIAEFLRIAKKLGLYVILRPGPYICGEWDMGGLPSWLLNVPGLHIRCNDSNFLSKVEAYYSELFDQIRPYLHPKEGNIIAVQIENEYGSFGNDKEYLQAIANIYGKSNLDCMLFTSDGPGYFMLNGGSLPGYLATCNFGSNPEGNFSLLKKFRKDQPLMCTEYWNGWFDHWYEEHHKREIGDTAETFKRMLEMGASVNFYMFHGGTNFGFLNGANFDGFLQPTVTSYDYNCPVSECGDLTEKYFAIREVIKEYKGFVPELTVANLPKKNYGKVRLMKQAFLFDEIEKLTKAVKSPYPLTMEEMEQDFGFLAYKIKLTGPFEELELSIDGLNDRAQVYLNGKLLGIKENTGKRDDKIIIGLDFGESAELLILVENLGRVNYGGHITDKKGITGGVRLANQYLYGWEMYPLTLDDIKGLQYMDLPKAVGKYTPAFLKGTFEVWEPADTFLKTTGFTKGCAFINGFNLGRYWNSAGPQKTLYLPAPLLRKGRNELVIFELEGYETPEVELTDTEELG